MIIVDATQLIVPQIIRQAIDPLDKGPFDSTVLFSQCGYLLFLGLVMAVLRYGWRNLLMGSARDLENGIRNELFNHILTLDMAYYNRTTTGDIMAHATSDINHVRMAFGFGLIAIVDTLLLGGATLAIMIWTHPTLTAFAMIPMPFLVMATRTLGKKMHTFHKTAQESFSKLTELVRESFFGIRIIKVYNFEPIIINKVEKASKDYFNKNLKRAFANALLKPLLTLFFNLSTLIILFYGGFLVMKESLTPGELVAFLQYLGILAWPVIAIGWMTNLFQRGMASLNRINTLLDSRPEVVSPGQPAVISDLSGRITFKDVSFAYGKDSPVLSNIMLVVEPGMSIGITGPPGSGKTSLVQLIPRLYNTTSGKIFMEDHDITILDLNFLRQHIAFMPQESFLFSSTIRDNILMGRSVKAERLDRIIEACCLKETLEKMPEGIDTVVGERGVTLSGGQKQRISIARALVRRPEIYISDDSFSALDFKTDSLLRAALKKETGEAAVIIVAQRVSTVMDADRILVLDDGKLVGIGRHRELMKSCQVYREIVSSQLSEEEMKAYE